MDRDCCASGYKGGALGASTGEEGWCSARISLGPACCIRLASGRDCCLPPAVLLACRGGSAGLHARDTNNEARKPEHCLRYARPGWLLATIVLHHLCKQSLQELESVGLCPIKDTYLSGVWSALVPCIEALLYLAGSCPGLKVGRASLLAWYDWREASRALRMSGSSSGMIGPSSGSRRTFTRLNLRDWGSYGKGQVGWV